MSSDITTPFLSAETKEKLADMAIYAATIIAGDIIAALEARNI